jgi:ABC-type transport system substrate-binding protein
MGEFFKSQMAQIGIKIKVNLHTRPEYFDARKKGKTQIIYDGWIADYPDAENFMQLLYGPNSAPGMNNSSFKNAEYDKLYEKMRDMPDSKERQKIIDQMTAIAAEEQVWIPNWVAKIFNVRQAWLKNYKYSDFGYNVYKYYGVDFEEKERLKQELFSR